MGRGVRKTKTFVDVIHKCWLRLRRAKKGSFSLGRRRKKLCKLIKEWQRNRNRKKGRGRAEQNPKGKRLLQHEGKIGGRTRVPDHNFCATERPLRVSGCISGWKDPPISPFLSRLRISLANLSAHHIIFKRGVEGGLQVLQLNWNLGSFDYWA